MRNLMPAAALASAMIFSAISGASAAPVAGYEALYTGVETSCSLPAGTTVACRDAITAYSAALITGGVAISAANESFTAVRADVFKINEPNPQFQADIDAIFEELLPNSGAIAPQAAPAASPV